MIIKYFVDNDIGYIIIELQTQLLALANMIDRFEYIENIPCIKDATCDVLGGRHVR